MNWTKDAESELAKAPVFVRKMARSAVEKHVREQGRDRVEIGDVQEVKNKYFGFINKDKETPATRIAVVRCHTVAEVCPGVGCLMAFNRRKIKFSDYSGPVELIGFFTCGGCSGRRVSRLVDKLLDYDLDIVHLSSCLVMESGEYPSCPFRNQIKATIAAKGVKVVAGTHH